MKADIYNTSGKKTGSISLPENLFALPWNAGLMHQVVTSMQANARTPVAHTKNRGDVSGGGKKPWRQKGTGRARHGSIRSPIWKGGGITHGPRSEKVYARAVPKKMRAKALFVALSKKLADGEIIFVDTFGIEAPKTALAKKAIDSLAAALGAPKLSSKKRNAALVALAHPEEHAFKSFRNLGNVSSVSVRDLNPVSVLGHSYIVIENPEAALAILGHRAPSKRAAAPSEPKKKSTHAATPESQKADQ